MKANISNLANKTIEKLFIPIHHAKIVPVMEYSLKFDGCSKGNPGPAGAGAVLYKNNEEFWSNSIYVGDKETNNVAEYNGLVMGLDKATELGIKEILVMGDSELIIKQMKGEYKVKSPSLIEYYLKAKRLSRIFENVRYEHIYRKDNSRADELANLGLQTKT
jgi:ribonuclease HI